MTDTDRPDAPRPTALTRSCCARPLDDALQLGRLGRVLPGQGLHRADAGLPRLRDRGRGAAREPQIIAELTVPETLDHLQAAIETAATPPIIMGSASAAP